VSFTELGKTGTADLGWQYTQNSNEQEGHAIPQMLGDEGRRK
jgi:hypothetical protein